MDKVVLGLSGGVDSAVAAALLKECGFEVHGLFLEVGLGGEAEAALAAEAVGIPLYISHQARALEKYVCAYFAEEYRHARTPNPCVVCNREVKFRVMAEYADEIGAKYLSTGHYARTGRDGQGRALLLRANSEKDQSYMLHRLPRQIIERCIFPLGEAEDKQAVRALAQKRALPQANKKDSMDVCFIPDGDWCAWLEKRGVCLPTGNFVDVEGGILGVHKGIHHYTVGQRKGLGIAARGRLFVHELRAESNEVVLSLEDVFRGEITALQMNYCAPEYAQRGPFSCEVRVRYSKQASHATVYPQGEKAVIRFAQKVRAPAAGQAAVLYSGDVVIGGGFIS